MALDESDGIDPTFLAAAFAVAATVGASAFMLWRVNAPMMKSRRWE